MSNIIDFEEYRKNKGGFAPVTIEEQRDRILLQREEIMEQRRLIENLLDNKDN